MSFFPRGFLFLNSCFLSHPVTNDNSVTRSLFDVLFVFWYIIKLFNKHSKQPCHFTSDFKQSNTFPPPSKSSGFCAWKLFFGFILLLNGNMCFGGSSSDAPVIIEKRRIRPRQSATIYISEPTTSSHTHYKSHSHTPRHSTSSHHGRRGESRIVRERRTRVVY